VTILHFHWSSWNSFYPQSYFILDHWFKCVSMNWSYDDSLLHYVRYVSLYRIGTSSPLNHKVRQMAVTTDVTFKQMATWNWARKQKRPFRIKVGYDSKERRRDSSVSTETRLRSLTSGDQFPAEEVIRFLFSSPPLRDQLLWPTHPPTQWTPAAFTPD
jgi:hypothetical protein